MWKPVGESQGRPVLPTPDQRHSWDDRALCVAAQHAGPAYTGAPFLTLPGAGAGFTAGQPTPATCRAQRYRCLASRGDRLEFGEGGPGQGYGHPGSPDCDLCKHACPRTTPRPGLSTQAMSWGLLDLWQDQELASPRGAPALDSSQHRGLPTTPGSQEASAAPRSHCVQARAHPISQTAVLQGLTVLRKRGSTTCDGSWTTQSCPSRWGGECAKRVLCQPGRGQGGTPGTKLEVV